MLKRSITKINEEYLVLHEDLFSLVEKIFEDDETDIVAEILIKLVNCRDYEKEINFIALTDEYNMLSYLPSKGSNSYEIDDELGDINMDAYYSSNKRIKVRIGRLIRRLIESLNEDEIKFEYTGKLRVTNWSYSTEIAIPELSSILYLNGITTSEFKITDEQTGDIYEGSFKVDGYIKYYDDGESGETRISFDNWKNGKERVINVNDSNSKLRIYGLKESDKFSGFVSIKTKLKITDADIEKFFNNLSALIKLTRPSETTTFAIVKGEDIKKYYNNKNYQVIAGPLGQSCMSFDTMSNFFNIYSENEEQVSMLILRNNTTDKIIGRAIVWKLDDGSYFMDRVYTLNSVDEKLFIQEAIKNGWYYRSNGRNISFYKGNKPIGALTLKVTLDKSKFSYYPYLDTLKYLNLEDKTLTNVDSGSYDYVLTSTTGKWYGYEKEY